ncbi:MAG: hypothetical protein HJJLKODD_00449 [Phycisphaerae bacterium]|nr:hypothetical protein [Phycisphaerae bacterium]
MKSSGQTLKFFGIHQPGCWGVGVVMPLIILSLAGSVAAQSNGDQQKGTTPQNSATADDVVRIVLELTDGASPADLQAVNDRLGVRQVSRIFPDWEAPEVTVQQLQARRIRATLAQQQELTQQIIAKQKLNQRLQARENRAPQGAVAPDLARLLVVELPDQVDSDVAVAMYAANPAVAYAGPVQAVQLDWIPNDPYYHTSGAWGQSIDDLWGLKKIESAAAWDVTQGAGVLVAVIDTGVDRDHPDITANIWYNTAEIPDNGVDDDLNGYVDDSWGYDFENLDADPQDDYGHGTHVAGTIAAVGNNGIGIVGVAPQSQIMNLKGFDHTGYGDDLNLAIAIAYAVQNGAEVINCSWGDYGQSQPITRAVAYAIAHGVVVVAAAGNSALDVSDHYPANLPGVIAVAASDPNDAKCSFSNYGYGLDVSAPGGSEFNVLSLLSAVHASVVQPYIVDGIYLRLAGTSMACPHVAGLVSLILEHQPGFSVAEIRQIVRTSADDVGEPGLDPLSGCGRINAPRALTINSVLTAEITAPEGLVQDVVAITGTAAGPGFVDYQLFYREIGTTTWLALGPPSSSGVTNGVLGMWDVSDLAYGKYVVKLVATDANGYLFQDASEVYREPAPVWPTSLVLANGEWPTWTNGAYRFNGLINGKSSYLLGDLESSEHMLVWWTGYYWNMHDDNEQRYTNSSTSDWPPAHGWLKMPEGTPSALTVSPGTVVASEGEWPLWANGLYNYSGLSNGKPSYLLLYPEQEQFMSMTWNGSYWHMIDDNEQRYSNAADTDWPPTYFWYGIFGASELQVTVNAMVVSGGEWPTWGNGTYYYAGIQNGRPSYLLGDPDGNEYLYMWWTGAYWNMHDADEQRYVNLADTLLPPIDGWLQMPSGQPSALLVEGGVPVP